MKIIAVLLNIALVATAGAQNLVPNPSFEDYDVCPDFWNQTDRAVGWTRYRGSPDYFHECDLGGLAGVPANVVGYQQAATGQAYMGGYLWCSSPTNTREHFGAALLTALEPGVPVYISFRVAPTTSGFLESMFWTAPGAGLRFTMAPYLQNGLAALPNAAALSMSFSPTDTLAWYTVSGMYVPDSAYQYVVLGSFFSDSLVSPEPLNPEGSTDCAYVYYDDICVSQVAEDCGVETGLDEHYPRRGVSAYPLPCIDHCTLVFDEDHSTTLDLELVDALGHIVWNGKLMPGLQTMDLSMSDIPTGVFSLRVTTMLGSFPTITLLHVSP